MTPPKFTIRLTSQELVTGAVATYDGHFLPSYGGAGRLRLAIANAEEGLPTGLIEPAPGQALLVVPEHGLIRVDLRGAEVVA